MGVSIDLKQKGKWVDITPGWRSQMATWLREIGGERDAMAFTDADITSLEYRKEHQRDDAQPPFNRSEEWTECFDKILAEIREHGVAMVRMSW